MDFLERMPPYFHLYALSVCSLTLKVHAFIQSTRKCVLGKTPLEFFSLEFFFKRKYSEFLLIHPHAHWVCSLSKLLPYTLSTWKCVSGSRPFQRPFLCVCWGGWREGGKGGGWRKWHKIWLNSTAATQPFGIHVTFYYQPGVWLGGLVAWY